jgi:major capsid protein 13
MAIGTKLDFMIYPEQFWGGVIEVLQQNTEGFNAASLGAMKLVTNSHKGDYTKESFLKSTAGLVTRRDITAVTGVADTKLTQGEVTSIKMNRRLGPVTQDRDSFRKIGVDPAEFSVMLGEQFGVAIAVDYINVATAAVRAAITNQGALLQYNATADTTKTANHTALVKGMALFGDKASRLQVFVMHSKPYFDLVAQTLVDKIVNVADVTVYSGNVATFGKPTIVIDSPSLLTIPGGTLLNTYDILALVEGAIVVEESEERDILSQPVTGLENLADRIQGEYAFNLKVAGCGYDNTQGVNPTDAAIATAANWLKVASDIKQLPGVRVTTN